MPAPTEGHVGSNVRVHSSPQCLHAAPSANLPERGGKDVNSLRRASAWFEDWYRYQPCNKGISIRVGQAVHGPLRIRKGNLR